MIRRRRPTLFGRWTEIDPAELVDAERAATDRRTASLLDRVFPPEQSVSPSWQPGMGRPAEVERCDHPHHRTTLPGPCPDCGQPERRAS